MSMIEYIISSNCSCRTSGVTNSPKSNCYQEMCIPQPYSAFTQAPMVNTRGVDGHDQPSDLPTISPSMTSLRFEPVTSALIALVGPRALPTLLKTIVVRKDAYPNLIVHSSKRPRRTQGELMDAANPPICQQISFFFLLNIIRFVGSMYEYIIIS